jgi:MFS family permease
MAALLTIVFGGPAASSPAALATLAALAGVAVAPVSACTRSLWRSLVPDRRLGEVVLALDATSQELIWTLGPLLCGIIVAVSSPAAALCFVAALSIIATAVYASAPAARQWRAPGSAEPPGRALSAPALRGFLVSIALTGACYGAMTVALPAIAGHKGAHSLLAGVLLGLFSLGSMLGGVCYGARAWALPLATRYRRLLLGIVAVTMPLILSGGSVPVAIVLSLLAGVAWAPTLTCQYGLTGTLAFPGAMTESFTWMTAAFAGGTAGGAALAGSLTRFGTGVPFAYASGLAVLAVALAFIQRGAFDAAVATQY